ncbi:LysR substrate-binding domain-containing protein [Sphingobium sp. DEHP117]|uniref:LysR substrate-binding domain-containing protein n=1 Tax=Sphingobium sp. DEHP117 TaxID=2993436 RepID=UPI0027D633A5|nr:LysR substrate-binding domain-containing protein [Sphingobium sp. DEHP117]MDQ4419193.1 LysR substrate-binding domain-containing protein [Sphingobium sp. DEHP117]
MRRLPPLTALEAFIQVARLGSVKAAAEELALSTPALSRRIQSLERYVGRPLFDRKHQALEINADGTALLNEIAPALDSIAVSVDKLISGGNQLRLRLAVLPLFASQRLLPILGELRQAFPQLHIDIETTPLAITRLGEGIDAAIILSRDPDPTLHVHDLGRESAFLVGGRDHLRAHPVNRPEDLASHTLLIHRDMPTLFDEWKQAMGVPQLEPASIDTFDSGPLMLEAAAQGLGIAAMLASHFTHSHDERIEKVLNFEIESSYRYYFVCRPKALQNRAVKIFHDWLVNHDV